MPLATNTSKPFTDDARTLTRTSPGPGSGVGTSITAAGDPSSASPNAFMLPPSPSRVDSSSSMGNLAEPRVSHRSRPNAHTCPDTRSPDLTSDGARTSGRPRSNHPRSKLTGDPRPRPPMGSRTRVRIHGSATPGGSRGGHEMHLLRTRRGLLMGFVVLALVAAACGSKAAANEGGSGGGGGVPPRARPPARPDPAEASGYNGGGGYGGGGSGYTGGGGGMAATTVMEGPGNSFTFSPSTVTVKQGRHDHARQRERHRRTPSRSPARSIDVETLAREDRLR